MDTLGSGGVQLKHAVLAIQTSSAQNVNVYVDGVQLAGTGNGVIAGNGSLSSVNGMVGIALPSINNSPILKGLSGYHTLTVSSGASIGIVPPGGGLPSTFASSQLIWIGDAAHLPTSISNLHANTLYIVSDLPRNILGLDLNQGNDASGVVNLLASEGLLAYSPTIGLNLFPLLATEMSVAPISNVAGMSFYDSAYDLDQGAMSHSALTVGETVYMAERISHLLSPGFVDIANAAKVSVYGNLTAYSPVLNSAFSTFNDHISHIEWLDSIQSLTSTANQAALSTVYTPSYQLHGVQIADTAANIMQLTSAQVSSLISFVKINAGNRLTLDIRDTVAGIQSIFGDAANLTSFIANVNSVLGPSHTGITYTTGVMEINDTVANIETAYANGEIDAMQSVMVSLISGAGANNIIPKLRVQDTVNNLNVFLVNQQDSPLWGMLVTLLALQRMVGCNWATPSPMDPLCNLLVCLSLRLNSL